MSSNGRYVLYLLCSGSETEAAVIEGQLEIYCSGKVSFRGHYVDSENKDIYGLPLYSIKEDQRDLCDRAVTSDSVLFAIVEV